MSNFDNLLVISVSHRNLFFKIQLILIGILIILFVVFFLKYRKFLQFNIYKLLLTIIFLVLSSAIIFSTFSLEVYRYYIGLPIYFFASGLGIPLLYGEITIRHTLHVGVIQFIIDLIFWYLVSCLILNVFRRN